MYNSYGPEVIFMIDKARLVVESHEVIHVQAQSADGLFSFYPGVRPVPIVIV